MGLSWESLTPVSPCLCPYPRLNSGQYQVLLLLHFELSASTNFVNVFLSVYNTHFRALFRLCGSICAFRYAMYTVKQYVLLYATFLGSMLTGASVVHHILKPDLNLPPVRPAETSKAAVHAESGRDKSSSHVESVPLK